MDRMDWVKVIVEGQLVVNHGIHFCICSRLVTEL